MTITTSSIGAIRLPLAAALLPLLGGGCDFRNESVGLQLKSYAIQGGDPRRLAIRAEVTGKLGGLRYKWFAVAGECEPQESDGPETVFKFAESAKRDRISLEVWRG